VSRPIALLVDHSIQPQAAEILRKTCEVRIIDPYPSEATLIKEMGEADVMLARHVKITAPALDAARKLKIVACHGVGVDRLDLAHATSLGIVVTTTGSANAAAVAESTFGLLLGLLRKVREADEGMRSGAWSRDALIGPELEGRTLGLIGLGAIGKRVARQALGFRMNVIAYDPNVPAPPPDLDVKMVPFETMLAQSDIVSAHPRLNAGNIRMMNAAAFAAMKPTACFINTSRGELVDEAALIDALRTGKITNAALDVFEKEPLPADSPLRKMPNVLLAPHVAGQTHEALVKIAICGAEQMLDELAGKQPRFVYNPEVYEIRKKLGQQKARA
jgi:phosphoglycerate dehydrogenase-like enzyme